MKIHENNGSTSNRSKSTCGYCRESGHNQYQCPHVKGDWENFLSKWSIPVDTTGRPIKRGYNCVAHVYGSSVNDPLTANVYNNGFAGWFRNCRKAYIKQKERGFKLDGTHKRSASSAPKKCGFCGSTNHTRRNCPTMEQFLKNCYKANENWRRACYQEVVQKHGISVGACVQVEVGGRWNEPKERKMGIIKSVNWNTINVLSGANKQSSFASSPLMIKVLVGSQTYEVSNCDKVFNTIGENGKLEYSWGNNRCELSKVITHSPTPLPPEWITSYKESFNTLAKKKTLEQLKSGMLSEYRAPNLVAHIDAWK